MMKTLIKHYFIITLSNTAMTKYQRLGGLNNRNVFPLQLWRLEVQDQGVSRLGEASILGLQITSFSLCPHLTFPLCKYLPSVSSSSYKDTSRIRLTTTHMTPFKFKYLFTDTISKIQSHFEVLGVVSASACNLGGLGHNSFYDIKRSQTCYYVR